MLYFFTSAAPSVEFTSYVVRFMTKRPTVLSRELATELMSMQLVQLLFTIRIEPT